MVKSRSMIKMLVLVSFILFPAILFSQTLVELSVQDLNKVSESNILWKELQGSSVLLLISDPDELYAQGVDSRLLDVVSDRYQYFWLYTIGQMTFDNFNMKSYEQVQILWNNEHTALAKLMASNFPTDFSSNISKRKIIFQKLTDNPISENFEFAGWTPAEISSARVIVDSVNIDSIYYTERHLTGMEPFLLSTGLDSIRSRHSFNPDIFKAQQYLKERFLAYGYPVSEYPFSLSGNTLYNLEAVKTGNRYPNQYFVICAHYDDMPSGSIAPGADDNGSGTATVIEAARVLRNHQFEYSIRFVLFPGEEQGLWGSYYYAQAAYNASDSILGVINMDMIGYDSDDDGIMEIHAGNLSSSQQIGTLMVNNVTSWGLGLVAQYKTSTSSGASDHASFWQFNYPAVMHIEDFQDFNAYYHTTNDRLSAMAMSYFQKNAKLSVGTLAVLAVMDSVTTGISDNQIPADFQLEDPYPNPFNPTVSLRYNLPQTGAVKIIIFDILGRPVKELLDSRQNFGWHEITWNATNEYGNAVSSGIYFMQVHTEYGVQMKKAVLLR